MAIAPDPLSQQLSVQATHPIVPFKVCLCVGLQSLCCVCRLFARVLQRHIRGFGTCWGCMMDVLLSISCPCLAVLLAGHRCQSPCSLLRRYTVLPECPRLQQQAGPFLRGSSHQSMFLLLQVRSVPYTALPLVLSVEIIPQQHWSWQQAAAQTHLIYACPCFTSFCGHP
jgi:hypothetical protein